MHLKNDGDLAPCGWKQQDVTIQRCWDECMSNSKFEERKRQVDEFNSRNKWKKRGIAVMPMKHDVGFTASFMNQGAALIMIFTDGSVSLNHGGTEMGQGLHTKMVQVASRALDVPAEKIYFSESSTDKIPNATATCGSMGSDLNGMAVLVRARLRICGHFSSFRI
jgi:xanthine dehydrogenase/oxidase